MRPAVRDLIEDPGRQQLGVGRHEDIVQHEGARHGAAHTQWVPVPLDAQAVGICGHAHESDRRVVRCHADHVVAVGGAGQRGEDLATAQSPAPVGGHRPSGDARGCARCVPLAERLGVDVALLDDAGEHRGPPAFVAGALGGGHGQVVGDLPAEQHRGGVHVEGEGRGSAVAPELFRHESVGSEVGAEPAVAGGYAETQQACLSQVGVVLEGEAGFTVVTGGPLGERRSEFGDDPHELTLPGSGRGARRGAHEVAETIKRWCLHAPARSSGRCGSRGHSRPPRGPAR